MAIGIFSTFLTLGQTYEKNKHISRSFEVTGMTEIQINNKYGTIHVIPWEKDSVRFEIDLKVKANKESKVDKIYEYIDFEFTSTSYYVIAQTVFTNKRNSFWTELSDITNMIFSGGNKAEIDYIVYLPDKNPIKISNKFGNIYCTDHNGKAEINISNGDIKAHDFTGITNITLEFGRGNIHSIQSGTLQVNYSEINVEKSDNLKISGKSATINIESINELNLESRRDKINIGKASKIYGGTSFSYTTIDELEKNITLKTEYGEIKIQSLSENFRFASINSTYTDIFLNISDNMGLNLEVNHDDRTEINLPASFDKIKTESKDPESGTMVTYGPIGKISEDPSRIDITTQSGQLSITLK